MYYFITAALLIIIMIIFAVGYNLSSTVMRPKLYTVQSAWDCDVALGKINPEKFNAMPKEEIRITSFDGIKIYGQFFPNGNSDKTVIIVHGVTFTLAGSIKYMDMFLSRGFNVLLLDHRSHGRSEGYFVTYGFREKHDLSAAIDWLETRFGKKCFIGIHGESMGAAITLQHAEIDPRARFLIVDSAFSDLDRELSYQIKKTYHLPRFPFIHIASLIMRLRSGMILSKVSPIRAVQKIQVPVFFIHGSADDLVPTSMAQELYDAKNGEKEIYIAEGSIHADSFWTHKDEYDRRVGNFLKRTGMI